MCVGLLVSDWDCIVFEDVVVRNLFLIIGGVLVFLVVN